MTTVNVFAIGSVRTPYQNVSTRLFAAFRGNGNSFVHTVLRYQLLLEGLRQPSLQQRLAKASITVNKTIEMLEKDPVQDNSLSLLTMSMSPFVLQSVLMGAVARDAEQTAKQIWPAATGPGIYAVGVAVNTRQGAFLNALELEELVRNLERYADAYIAFQTAAGSRSAVQTDLVRFARSVDAALEKVSSRDSDGCRFLQKDVHFQRVRTFASRLRHRATDVRQADPTGQVHQMQSPLYIGCSETLDKRTKDYAKPALDNINRYLGLTLCILAHLDLKAVAVVRPVMPVWSHDRLGRAERLVSALSSSLLCQDGFNSTEADGRKSEDGGELIPENEVQTLVDTPCYHSSVTKATEKLQRRNALLERLAHIENGSETLRTQLDELDLVEKRARLQSSPIWSNVRTDLRNIVQADVTTLRNLENNVRLERCIGLLSVLQTPRETSVVSIEEDVD